MNKMQTLSHRFNLKLASEKPSDPVNPRQPAIHRWHVRPEQTKLQEIEVGLDEPLETVPSDHDIIEVEGLVEYVRKVAKDKNVQILKWDIMDNNSPGWERGVRLLVPSADGPDPDELTFLINKHEGSYYAKIKYGFKYEPGDEDLGCDYITVYSQEAFKEQIKNFMEDHSAR